MVEFTCLVSKCGDFDSTWMITGVMAGGAMELGCRADGWSWC